MVCCSNCEAAGFQCTFNQKGPPRGPPKGYTEYLEDRLDKMESLMATVTEKYIVSTVLLNDICA